jgi:hypothetical protein
VSPLPALGAHATSNCHAAARFLKCAGPHLTYTHTEFVPQDKIKCANCGEGHVANDTNCPVYQKRVENINSNKEQQTLVKPAETLVLAPIPATNPWNKDKTENRGQIEQSDKTPENSQSATATATGLLLTELKKLNELIDIKKIKMTVTEDSNFYLDVMQRDQIFYRKVLLSDECTFSNNGIFNRNIH